MTMVPAPVYEDLFEAVLSGEVDAVVRLLRSGARRRPTRTGVTVLYTAAVNGRAAVVRLLLAAGADPAGACGEAAGDLPLCGAACNGHTEAVRALLAAGAWPDQREEFGVHGAGVGGAAGPAPARWRRCWSTARIRRGPARTGACRWSRRRGGVRCRSCGRCWRGARRGVRGAGGGPFVAGAGRGGGAEEGLAEAYASGAADVVVRRLPEDEGDGGRGGARRRCAAAGTSSRRGTRRS